MTASWTLPDDRCFRCLTRVTTTAGPCTECGWPLYDIQRTGPLTKRWTHRKERRAARALERCEDEDR